MRIRRSEDVVPAPANKPRIGDAAGKVLVVHLAIVTGQRCPS
jgi:hypothetical protein